MPGFRRSWDALLAALVLLAVALPAAAGDYRELEQEVREFTLPNGMHFLVVRRPEVPVFSFNVYVDAGSVNEVQGITGLAHIIEHMAFKGTTEIGTSDAKAERRAMVAEDAAFAALQAERRRAAAADSVRLAALEEAFARAKEAARQFVVSNEFAQVVENNGGVGLNASTSSDATNYYYSFPSNRLELWAYLESNRLAAPVFREFYTEKDGPVTEERRMAVDNNPIGMLVEQLSGMAFSAHPYGHPLVGYMSDLNSITRTQGDDFYRAHYVGNNMACAIVGDVDYDEVKRVADKYFTRIPGPAPTPEVDTVEPKQLGEKRIVIEHTAQPLVLMSYHKGSATDPDDAVYEAIADVLGQGRTSRLYQGLVKDRKIAVQAGGFSGFPGSKYPNLMLIYAVPANEVEPEEIETALVAEIERLAADGMTADELAGVKRRARANFIRSLRGNMGLARQLTHYQMITGDWRNLFKQLDEIEAVTLDDVQRVAGALFAATNRTVAMIRTRDQGAEQAAAR